MTLKPKHLALVIAGLFASGLVNAQSAPAKADEKKDDKKATELGTVRITGEGDRLGAGTLIQEDSAKGRSTATRAAIEKTRATSNPFQAIETLPGVNTFSNDATGLFGGNLRVRGFNSDQMGFTVNGAPVNDSGNFAVFPQEYVDQENTCEVFVTQGSADNEAPHVGATGGNVGIVSCDPSDKRATKLQATAGQLNLRKLFLRYDTGLLGDFKAFLSYSKAKSSKFRGPGQADRDHIDFKAMYDLGRGNKLQFTALYNQANNNNYLATCKGDFALFGDSLDYSNTFIKDPAGANGTAQAATTTSTGCRSNGSTSLTTPYPFYKLSVNPFKNAIVTGAAHFNVAKNVTFDFEPYFWYGFGTGGVQQTTLREGGTFRGGLQDINGDGDKLDTVTVYRGSLTQTHRPGATVKLNWQLGNQRIMLGYWGERARHHQTAPATYVNPDGSPWNAYLDNISQLVKRADGTVYQNRDWLTISTADSLFLQDAISLANDRLVITPAIKTPRIRRDFNNYANEGTNSAADYRVVQTFRNTNPSLGARYNIDDTNQVFGSITKGSRVPSNFVYANNFIGGKVVLPSIKAETSVNTDMGYRYLNDKFTASGTVFFTSFKDRLAQAFDPVSQTQQNTNVGDSTNRGFELELGTAPVNGFSVYGSLTYTKSNIKNDLTGQNATVRNATNTGTISLTNITLPLAGKEFPDTPNWLAGLTFQYTSGAFLASLSNKYTGDHYATLTNDEKNTGRWVSDLNLGYRMSFTGDFIKTLTLRANISNLFNKKYYLLNAGSGTSFGTFASLNGQVNNSQASYYVGAPRFTSVSLIADF
jgi:iron complex outermembrane receptor protein